MPEVNFDEISDENTDFKPLPTGRYNVQVVKCSSGQNKNGHEMWTLELLITNGPHKSRRLWDRISFGGHQMNLFRVKRCFDACGLDVSKKGNYVPPDLIDHEAAVDVIPNNYEGKRGNAIDGFGSNGGWHKKGSTENVVDVPEEEIPF